MIVESRISCGNDRHKTECLSNRRLARVICSDDHRVLLKVDLVVIEAPKINKVKFREHDWVGLRDPLMCFIKFIF